MDPGRLLILIGAPGSGRTAVTPGLRAALPGVVVLDLDQFLDAGSRLAGLDLRQPAAADRWPAYAELGLTSVSTVLAAGHDVLLLCPLTPDEVPRSAGGARWAVLDCADPVRRERLRRRASGDDVDGALADAARLRGLGLPVLRTDDLDVDAAVDLVARWARGPSAGALLVTGTVGVGKSTVAAAVGDLLVARAVPHAVVDLDGLRGSWPAPPDDPFTLALELRNLASVVANYRAAGIHRFVLAGVVERRGDLARYERAVGDRVAVVRLRADPDLVGRRLAARHALDPAGLAWHLARATELDAILDAAHLPATDIPIGSHPPAVLADQVTATVGW